MRNLPEFITDLLESRGAIVEKSGADGLDVIASPEISRLLGLPEYHRLSFASENMGKDALPASYDSEYFRSLERLFADTGRRAAVTIETPAVHADKIAKTLTEHLPLTNATLRMERREETSLAYYLVFFRFTALSDDRHEGMLSVLVNPLTGSTALLENALEELADRMRPLAEAGEIPAAEIMKIFGWACTAVTGMVKERLKDFIRSAERRLNRDVRRVYEYYETLKEEVTLSIQKKAAAGQQMQMLTESTPKEGIERLQAKLPAIDAEREWKIQDLTAKYALEIRLAPLCALRIQATVPVFWITLKRRLASRLFPVTYNPLLKKLDPLPCESCFHPAGAYTVCDEKLHVICTNCFTTCLRCGKPHCPVCHGGKCPKSKS